MADKNRTRRIADKFAKYLISIGGIGTIAAVLLVFVFLAVTVLPLFEKGKLTGHKQIHLKEKITPVHGVVDDSGVLGVVFNNKGFDEISFVTGDIVKHFFIDNASINTFSYSGKNMSYILSTDDGRLLESNIIFQKEIIETGKGLGKPTYAVEGDSIIESDGKTKNRYSAEIKTEEVLKLQDGKKIYLVDWNKDKDEQGNFLVFITEDDTLHISKVTKQENILTGEITKNVTDSSLSLSRLFGKEKPKYLKINSSESNIFIFFENSRFVNIDIRDFNNPKVVEDRSLFNDRMLTCVNFLIGRNTILIGDSKGYVTTWWLTEDNLNKNNYVLTNIHQFYTGDNAPVKFIYPSQRNKSFAVLNANNRFSIFHMTAEKLIVRSKIDNYKESIILLNQKNNLLALIGEDNIIISNLDAPHPETSFKTLFGKVQYELSDKPEYVWQSSSASDDFEPKFSLIPLIVGTVKATFITLLFAVPVAILAAIYTSEFVSKKYRTAIKSTVEVMASLPSVVLGFIAGLIVSPFVENVVLSVLCLFITIPFVMLLLGNLVQLLPKEMLNNIHKVRLWAVLLVGIPLGVFLGIMIAQIAEKMLFYNDFKLWLHKMDYSPFGGWCIVLLPIGVILTLIIYRKFLYDYYENILEGKSYTAAGIIEVVKFLLLTILSLILTFFISYLVTKMGLDLRGGLPFVESIMSTYVQRNALIVGFIMGFAVIPIIYTVSEDALNAVPDHLRTASLATGATKWQTVINIVLPVAMSGIFSAIMIGFGRAIGETMIVLMAAGNTPIMDMNIFSGFRTLSANIAVELPEAVIGSTHYRVLYLAALVLFVMTFIINTFAEMIRIRYRKKSSQL
jgi:phosphate transport system permease protein